MIFLIISLCISFYNFPVFSLPESPFIINISLSSIFLSTPVQKCCFSAVADVGFHRLQPKNNGAMSFFTGRSTGIVRCFFLGTLLAFQFVVFHAVRVSSNLKYSGMMDQSVKNGSCHGTVLEYFSPFGKGDIWLSGWLSAPRALAG